MTAISPSSGPISGGTAVTITGTGFLNGATVSLGGTSATGITVVSSTSITATTPAHAAGAVNVVVTNTDTQSGTLTNGFTYTNPVPSITSLNPSTVAVGSATFTLTVNGTNFISTSVVQVGGNSRVTTFVNSTQVTAAILASDVATAGSLSITVVNPAPGGGTSNTATVSVVNPNPVPSIATISPTNVIAGSSGFTLTVNGTNFVGASVVRVNGNNRTTAYISSVQLTAQIPSSDVVGAGSLSITVLNPTPGGGTSNSVTLTVNPANYSLSLDGTSNTYATAWGSSFAVSGAITVEGWIKTTSSYADILRCWNYGASGGYDLTLTKTSVTFSILGTSAYVDANVAISDGLWHHVAGVFDGNSPANVMVYVDGVLRGSSLWMMSLNSNSQTVTIGYSVNALLDEIRVTASAVYTGNFTPPRHLTVLPTTVALWKFDGLSTLDSTSFHNNLTLFGNATFSPDTP